MRDRRGRFWCRVGVFVPEGRMARGGFLFVYGYTLTEKHGVFLCVFVCFTLGLPIGTYIFQYIYKYRFYR